MFTFSSTSHSLIEHCQSFGSISSVFLFDRVDKVILAHLFIFQIYYSTSPMYFSYFSILQNYALVEYWDKKSLNKLFSTVKHFPNIGRIPFSSHFLYYRNNQRQRKRIHNKTYLKCHIVKDYRNIDLNKSDFAACENVRLYSF